jgi:hypothetical protein
MMYSPKRKCIFVHVPKTAGIACRMAMRTFIQDARGRIDDSKFDELTHGEDYHHQTALEIRKQIGEDYCKYFTFGFVRNPWERMVSWYFMAVQKPELDTPSLIRIRELSFEQFLEMDPPGAHVNNSQLDYLADTSGNPMVSFVGRYENLEQDWRTVARTIRINPMLSCQNYTKHEDYRHYYNEHTKQIVAKRFAKDIDALGYLF